MWSVCFFLALDCFSRYVGNRVVFCFFPVWMTPAYTPPPNLPLEGHLEKLEANKGAGVWVLSVMNICDEYRRSERDGGHNDDVGPKKALEVGVKNSLDWTDFFFHEDLNAAGGNYLAFYTPVDWWLIYSYYSY